MGTPDRPDRWYALSNGILLSEGTDEETGRPTFFQLQAARPLTPDDLRRHDQQTTGHLMRFASRWSLVLSVAVKLLLAMFVVVPVGVMLVFIDATNEVGRWIFWIGLPLGMVTYVVAKTLAWRLESGVKRIQVDAGLVPGMVDEIEHPRGLELIATHGVAFQQERDVSAQ